MTSHEQLVACVESLAEVRPRTHARPRRRELQRAPGHGMVRHRQRLHSVRSSLTLIMTVGGPHMRNATYRAVKVEGWWGTSYALLRRSCHRQWPTNSTTISSEYSLQSRNVSNPIRSQHGHQRPHLRTRPGHQRRQPALHQGQRHRLVQQDAVLLRQGRPQDRRHAA